MLTFLLKLFCSNEIAIKVRKNLNLMNITEDLFQLFKFYITKNNVKQLFDFQYIFYKKN